MGWQPPTSSSQHGDEVDRRLVHQSRYADSVFSRKSRKKHRASL